MAALPARFQSNSMSGKKIQRFQPAISFFSSKKVTSKIWDFSGSLAPKWREWGMAMTNWSLLFVALQAAISRLKLPNLINCGAKTMDLDHQKCSPHLNPWKMNGWNLHQITCLKRNETDLNQTSMIVFHVNLLGCSFFHMLAS